jgi:hypothetical protein
MLTYHRHDNRLEPTLETKKIKFQDMEWNIEHDKQWDLQLKPHTTDHDLKNNWILMMKLYEAQKPKHILD